MTVPQSILVTGASSGVGRSLVEHLKGRFHVIAAARRLDAMTARFGDDPNVECHGVDLADAAARTAFLDRLRTRHPYIPYVVNNAGVMLRRSFAELSAEDLNCSLALNAFAPMEILRALLPAMRRNGFGRAINLTSGAPFNCFPGFAAYSASKGALNALTLTAAKENADLDIKINLMSPGPVRTEMAPDAPMEPAACHPTVDHLLALPADGPTGHFFWLGRDLPVSPDFNGVHWLEGTASDRFPLVIR